MREQSLFIEAIEKEDPVERGAFLDQACTGDPALRARIERLLQRHHQADNLLDTLSPWPLAPSDPPPIAEGPGTVIGPYKLLEPIGEGGMGVVYLAQQMAPVRRRVALKIIKPGMDTRQVVARFEAERQALALMDHPNIARVHDAGATDSGRPYFVMELIRGIALTDYCDREQLPITERLDLFVLVCRAVQHAHQKGVIHRDLKPTNILVTVIDGVAVPKVIDFGVAKATGRALTERTLVTGFHQFLGSPLYMSPEQADLAGVDVDTRSDIYSLGVLLYELLTGTTPFDGATFREVAFDEVRRLIREVEPPKPSTRLSSLDATRTTVAAHRRADAHHLARTIKGELDWIVMKALEKDRRRRYVTANDFAADVMRHRNDQPVEACPPSAWYWFKKSARRHRGMLTTTVIVSLALLTATGVSIRQAVRARNAESQAETDFRLARDAVDRVILRVSDELASVPGTAKMRRALLQDALAFYQAFLAAHRNDPEVKFDAARAAHRIAAIHELLGDLDQVPAPAEQAIRLLGELVDASPHVAEYRLELAESHNLLAECLYKAKGPTSSRCLRERRAAVTHMGVLAATHPRNVQYRQRLASLHCDLGLSLSTKGTTQFVEAETHLRTALTLWDRMRADFPNLPEDWVERARIHHWIGNLLSQTSSRAEAEREYRRSLTPLEAAKAEGPATSTLIERIAHVKFFLAHLKLAQGERGEAERLLQETADHLEPLWHAFREVRTYSHQLGVAYRLLAFSYWATGRMAEAEKALFKVLAVRETTARDHDDTLLYREQLALILCDVGLFLDEVGRSNESAEAFRRVIGLYEGLAAQAPGTALFQMELSWWLSICPASQLRDPARALRIASRGIALNPGNSNYWTILGIARYRTGDLAAATPALKRAFELTTDERAAAFFLAMTYARQGDITRARTWHAAGVKTHDPWLPSDRLDRRFAAEAISLIQAGCPPADSPQATR